MKDIREKLTFGNKALKFLCKDITGLYSFKYENVRCSAA